MSGLLFENEQVSLSNEKEDTNDPEEVKLTPFDYIRSINETKIDLMNEESTYNAYIVNKGLSYGKDTVFYANEMNLKHFLPNRMQYDFLRSIVPKGKRYNKWVKSDKIDNIELIKEYYNYSANKALKALSILTNDQIDDIKKKLDKGGMVKSKHKKK